MLHVATPAQNTAICSAFPLLMICDFLKLSRSYIYKYQIINPIKAEILQAGSSRIISASDLHFFSEKVKIKQSQSRPDPVLSQLFMLCAIHNETETMSEEKLLDEKQQQKVNEGSTDQL